MVRFRIVLMALLMTAIIFLVKPRVSGVHEIYEAAIDKNKSSQSSRTVATGVLVPPPPSAVLKPEPGDLQKLKALDDILVAGNDNDPRLDAELRVLSPFAKQALTQKYKALAPESFNKRGTVVFLIGRSLSSESDMNFLNGVLSDPACLSLADCSRPSSEPTSPDAEHHESGNEVTLVYPQIVAVKAMESYLMRPFRERQMEESALAGLRAARSSRNQALAQAAARALEAVTARR